MLVVTWVVLVEVGGVLVGIVAEGEVVVEVVVVVGNSAMPVAIAAVSASLIVMGIAAVMRLRRGSGFELCCCISPCIAW